MYSELIQISQQKKYFEAQLDQKKAKFQESIALEVAALKDLQNEEERLRENALISLKGEKKTSHKENGFTINLVQKITRKIDDPGKLLNSFIYNKEKIEQIVKDEEDINEYFDNQVVIKDKEKVLNVVNKYQAIEGKLLEGVTDQLTEYLMIKENI